MNRHSIANQPLNGRQEQHRRFLEKCGPYYLALAATEPTLESRRRYAAAAIAAQQAAQARTAAGFEARAAATRRADLIALNARPLTD